MLIGRFDWRNRSTVNKNKTLRTSSRWGLLAVSLLILATLVGITMVSAGTGSDDKITSRGKYQIVVNPQFRPLMVGYPGYDGSSKLDSPVLYDPNTLIGRSV